MKRFIAAGIFLVVLSVAFTGFAESGIVLIDGEAGGDLTIGETVTIDKLCDLTLLSYVADTYAMSIPAYERPEDETVITPKTAAMRDSSNYWGNHSRYKYESNGNASSYADMYYDIYAAEKASSDEYKLLDVRVSVLNRMIAPLELAKVFNAKATFMDEYDFPLTYLRTEVTDTLGNKNEWLTEAKDIPVLVQRNVHFIFEVPNIVAESRESLIVTLGVENEEYNIVIR